MRRPIAIVVGIVLIAAAVGIAWAVLRDDDRGHVREEHDCAGGTERVRDDVPPRLADRANGTTQEDGNRTWRWDLQVDDACQGEDASVSVDVRPGQRLEGCGAATFYASATSGLGEREIELAGDGGVLHGQATVTPARPDLQAGNGSFVVSLAVTLPSSGLELQDEQCLDAAVNGFTLAASFARA